jgi:hypothetical protein
MLVSTDEDSTVQWIYIGSHNFSLSAWGRLEQRRTVLNVSNYEIGVLLPAKSYPMPVTNLPMVIPPPKYEGGSGTLPFLCKGYAASQEQ